MFRKAEAQLMKEYASYSELECLGIVTLGMD